MYGIRYYAPDYRKTVHEAVLSLLEEIRARHHVPYEVVEVRHTKSPYSDDFVPDSEHQKELYGKDFLPRKGVLKPRTGQSLRRLLRSQSGNHFVAGTVAITSNGRVEWLAHYGSGLAAYGPEPALAFLKAVLDRGTALLPELCPAVTRSAPEQRLVKAFLDSGLLKGIISQEVPVGRRQISVDGTTHDWRKFADLLIETDIEVWIIEAKTQLNYDALGEVLTYATLYESQCRGKPIRMGIVCGAIDEEILEACHKCGVMVFEVGDSGIRGPGPA